MESPSPGACDLTGLGWCLVAGQGGELAVREEAEAVRHRRRATAQEGPPPVRQEAQACAHPAPAPHPHLPTKFRDAIGLRLLILFRVKLTKIGLRWVQVDTYMQEHGRMQRVTWEEY